MSYPGSYTPPRFKVAKPFWLPSMHSGMHNGQANRVGIAGQVWISPTYVIEPMIFSRINVGIGIAGGAGTKLRVGLYQNADPVNPKPDGGKLLFDSGDLDATIIGNRSIIFPNKITVLDGYVWCCIETQDAVINFDALQNNSRPQIQITTDKLRACHFVQAYGPLPDPCPATVLDDAARLDNYLLVDSLV